MKNKDIKFKSLTPEILPHNKEIYTEALDYAFDREDIRNIAITGVYGAGKSSVWNTYRKQKSEGEESSDFDNIITIRLGKYNDKKEQNDNKSEKELENRVERQIINQISAQIKSSEAPMSKYKYKENLEKWKLSGIVFLTLLFFGQIFLWGFREEIVKIVSKTFTGFDDSIALYLTIGMFISSVGIFLIHFFKKGKLKFSKIQYKDMEAQFAESNQNDETILERDMKEIVYLLSSSNTSVVVFEDLDRYESVDIFIKLKELNFLLNAYLDTNGMKVRKNKKDRIVRFIYLIKDGLFYTKDRTKFFDFILPIIPVVDSKTSENHLIELLGINNSQDQNQDEDQNQDDNNTIIKKQDISLDKNILRNISLYIDDMRILRNIVNEFKVYSSFNAIDLDYDKLFALVTVKNIYPREFELLQQDKGYIFNIFNQIDKVKIQKNREYEDSIKNKRREVKELLRDSVNDKFEKMSLYITTDVVVVNNNNTVETWSKFLSYWEQAPGKKYKIISKKSKGQPFSHNYDTFLDTFVYTSDEITKSIKEFTQDRHSQLKELLTEIKNLESQRKQIKVSRIQDLISNMNPDEINELFKVDSKENMFAEYPLVRYLIVEGILDETYAYYKGNFDVDKLNALKRNDYIFLKRLLEKGKPDIFFKLDSPKEIMDRLEPDDFTRFSILNLYLFKECVKNEEREKILNTIITVDTNNLYEELIQIIDMLSLEETLYFVDILINNKIVLLERILNFCSKENQNALRNLTYSILMNEKMLEDEIDKFKDYIQLNENLIEFVTEDKLDEFIERAREKNIKFNDLKNIIDVNKENYTDIIDKIMSQLSNEDNQIEFTTYEARNDSEESDSVGFGNYLNMSSDSVYSSILDMIQNGTNNNDLIEFSYADERSILDDTEIINSNISFAKYILIGYMKEKLIQIEKYQLYRITLNNIIFLAENILGEKIEYESLLSTIYENDKLKSMQEYIDNNFDKIISEYIEQNSSNNEYVNTQEILIKILNSNISLENKKKYVDKNSISIKNLEDINTDTSLVEVLYKLFDKDKVTFTSSNLNYYWNLLNEYKWENNIEAQKYVDLFIEVLNKRLSIKSGKSNTISTEEDIKQILSQCDSICNALINSKKVDDNLFVFALENATKPIEKLDQSLDKERIKKLFEKKLIKLNEENNKTLKDKLNI